MPGAGCYQSGAEIPPWRLTNRKEATVSQSVRMRQAAFESTNEDPAESEAEGGKTPKEAEADRKRERGEGEENTKPDADRGRRRRADERPLDITRRLAGVPSFPLLSS